MNTSAIRHRSTVDMCYAADNDTAVVRLCTGRDVKQAYIICEDPFIHRMNVGNDAFPEWFGVKHEMFLSMELEEHLIWEYRTKPPYKRLQYYFEVTDGSESCLVYDNKICRADEQDNSRNLTFKLPWMNPADVITPPEWVKNTVWYQLMPDRFCKDRTEDSFNGRRFLPWGENVRNASTMLGGFYGGDLKGITSRLPYLKELGINGIYLTPIFLSDSYHRYNTFDYNAIDPLLGTEEDMKELVRRAHELGIRVMLDGVFNHCGTRFFAWSDVMRNKKNSKYYDWFFINSDNITYNGNTADGRFFTFAFFTVMPKINTNNPEVIQYFCDVCSRWVRDWDIDGIRFDVGDEVSHILLRELRRTLKPIKKDLFLLGEVWFDSINWLEGDEYDSVMNYPVYDCVNNFSGEKGLSSQDFMYALNACFSRYPEQVNEVMFNFIDTHDTKRISEECEGNIDLLLQKLAVLFTMPGTPCIFYGTELAFMGATESDARKCMPWDDIDSGKYSDLIGDVSRLIKLRRQYSQLEGSRMDFIHHPNQPRLLHYVRSKQEDDGTDQKIGVCLNCSDEEISFKAEGNVLFSRLYDGETLLPVGTVIYEM